MKAAASLLSLLLVLTACNPRPAPTPEPKPSPRSGTALAERGSRALPQATGTFDYYLLNLSWSPEFCYSHADKPECAQHLAFVLHGLWPQNLDGTYPQNCADAPGPANPAQYSDIYPDPGLLQHEWKTHGTCSGLSPDDFFSTARKATQSVAIPSQLTQLTSQISMPPEQILGLFTATNPQIPRGSLALSCGNNYLTAVEVCLNKQLQPTSCGPTRSCRANTVRIPPPQ